MQYQVPQFIEIEDKIIGPLTLKQFLYLAGPAVISFILFFALSFGIWLLLTIILGVLGLSLAFVKINGRPFINFLLSVFWYYFKPKIFIWKKAEPASPETIETSYIEKAPKG
ncbi:MAG: PrgI family protein [bacterium]|nr:PrgI family protein [bacterium]